MKTDNIKTLLEKYFEGDTSREDEKILKQYFLSNDVDESLKEYKALFQVFTQESKIQSEGISDELPFANNINKSFAIRRNASWAIAASILILMGSWFLLETQEEQEMPSKQELLLAQKYLNIGLKSFNVGFNKSNDLMKKTEMIKTHTAEALNAGIIYQAKTQEILKLNYIDKSLEKFQKISSLKESRIKVMM